MRTSTAQNPRSVAPKRMAMKCKNCGLQRNAHVVITADGRRMCPNGSGGNYPATVDIKIELHYRPGEDHPWVASWDHLVAGAGKVVAGHAVDALEFAAHAIEKRLEEKSVDEIATEEAIKG
jgi:hypothetical protein